MNRTEIIFLALTILQTIVNEWIRRRQAPRARAAMVEQVVERMGNGKNGVGHGG